MRKKWLQKLPALLLAAALIGTALGISAAAETVVSETRTLYTLPSVDNMSLAGTHRGNNHDRQHLGIYMPAGSSFTICQSNTSYGYDLTLVTYSDATGNDQSYTIPKDGTAVTVTANVDCVPFINTQYHAEDTDEAPQVAISDKNGVLDLIYFTYGDEEEAFFSTWRDRQDAYAVIESKRMTMLVPYGDIDLIVPETQTAYTFGSITELLEYYDDFCAQYDRYIGLAYNADDPLDRNVDTRFFIRADVTNADYAAAYYGGAYTAQCGGSISGYLSRGWLNLHECGHGYEGSLDNQELPLVEVMNNILAYYYQQTFLTEDDGGWLGEIADVERGFQAQRKASDNFNSYGAATDLYFFVNLLNRADISSEGAMAAAHSSYRHYLADGIQYTATDLFTEVFSNYSGYNLVPYMNSWNLTPSDEITAAVYEQELPMLYYLRELVGSDSRAEAIRAELGLEGIYSLVSTDELAAYGMTGSLRLTLDIDDLRQIEGKTVYLKNGAKTVASVVVNGSTLTLQDLPVGVYWLQLPNTRDAAYDYGYEYVVISENGTMEKTVSYQKLEHSALAFDTEIRFLGLGDWQFATACFELDGEQISLHFRKNGGAPHVYYGESQYAKIEVLDAAENTVYTCAMTGVDEASVDETIPLEIGYTVQLTHDESNGRLRFYSTLLHKAESYSQTGKTAVSYTVTEYGLVPSGSDALSLYTDKLGTYVEMTVSGIPAAFQYNKYRYFIQKNALLSAIAALPEAERETYLPPYFKTDGTASLLNGSAPEIMTAGEIHINTGSTPQTLVPTNLTAQDLEDGEMVLTTENTSFDLSGVTFGAAGSYDAPVTVRDLDGNPVNGTVTVVISDAVTDLISYDYTDLYTIRATESLTLDPAATGLLADGTTIPGTITWEAVSEEIRRTVGVYTASGTLHFPGYEAITVTAQLQVVENVAALRNIASTTAVGIVPALPKTVSGILIDGTLFGSFSVQWEDMTAQQFSEAGSIVTVHGSAEVLDRTMPVTASVRVLAMPETTSNVAGTAELSESCVNQADNLNSLNNGVKESTYASERWTNYNERWDSEYATLTFRLDDLYVLDRLNLYYYYDGCSMEAASIQVRISEDGVSYTAVTGSYEANEDYTYSNGTGRIFLLDTPAAARYIQITLQQQNGTSGSCVGLTEVEILAYGALARGSDGALSDLAVNGTTVKGFSPDTLTYTTSSGNVTARADANMGITILPEYEGVVRILTVSEDGSQARTYAVTLDDTPPLTAPRVTVSAVRAGSGSKITLTGRFEDYENQDHYYPVTAHGLVYYSTTKLGTKILTVNTPGRTKVSFSSYKADGSFSYTMTPTSASVRYTVRAFLAYTDDSGRTMYAYSDPIVVSYQSLTA